LSISLFIAIKWLPTCHLLSKWANVYACLLGWFEIVSRYLPARLDKSLADLKEKRRGKFGPPRFLQIKHPALEVDEPSKRHAHLLPER